MSLLNFFSKKNTPFEDSPSSISKDTSRIISNNNNNLRLNSKKEFVKELENKLNKKLQLESLNKNIKQENTINNKILVKLMLCDKKNSSARYKHPYIELRLPKHVSKKILEEHSNTLVVKLYDKINKKNQKPNVVYKNSTQELLNSIQRGYFYIESFRVNLILNKTKTITKVENDNFSQKIITISLPKIELVQNLFNSNNYNYSENSNYYNCSFQSNSEKILINEYDELEIKKIKKIEQQIAKILCVYFKELVEVKVNSLNLTTLQSTLKSIDLNYVNSKWGHCSSKNDIMIHISLLNAPKEVFEYVIYHELAHTIHKNHSSSYWRVCNSLTPYTKHSKSYLKNSPPILFNEHPNTQSLF
ncbi:MAG: M48 family metallopeptidase [Nanoarchaeota archaeon]|nr:M48 family metallopeptidase [Nanoarchaeota archaeon]